MVGRALVAIVVASAIVTRSGGGLTDRLTRDIMVVVMVMVTVLGMHRVMVIN